MPPCARTFTAQQSTGPPSSIARTSGHSLRCTWGSGHPVVCSLGRSELAYQRLVAATAIQAAGVVWFVGGWSFGLSLAIAAGVAQAVLVCRVALLGWSRRELCLELIAHGGPEVPLPRVG